MKRRFTFYFAQALSAFAVCLVTFCLHGGAAHAAAAYNSSELIGEGVFENSHTMSVSDIQTFLNNKNSGIKNYSDTEDCSSSPRYSSFTSFYNSHYSCGQLESVAQIIYDVAQAYQINPQVILATMQKEQSLVTDPTSPGSNMPAINCAMGYDSCSDTVGFFHQVDWAAWQFRADIQLMNGNSYWNWSSGSYACAGATSLYSTGLYPGRTVTFTDPGGTAETITIANAATAALYCYTPYVGPYSVTGYSGSYNFVINFENWFGSITGLDYSWWVDSFTFNPSMGEGTTQTVTLKATNTGNDPWYAHSADPNFPVRLGTWPAQRASLFSNNTWLSSVRPVEMSENVVMPGSDGTFTFQITAPSAPGTYVEPFNLVMENKAWLPWAGFSPTITVTNQYSWQVTNVAYGLGTGNMAPGSNQQIIVTAKNTGSVTWYKNTSGQPRIWLGTWPPQRGSAVEDTSAGAISGGKWSVDGSASNIRITQANEDGVVPCSTDPNNCTANFVFNVVMPSSGNYYEQLNLVAEGITWFNNTGLTLYLHGQTYAWQPLYYTISTGTAAMPRGSDFTITLKARNTGEATWTQGGSWPVRLGTWPPQSSSPLYSAGGSHPWIASVRPAGLQETSVVPCSSDPNNCTGTFIFDGKMPSTPGESNQYFNLVAEGLEWLNDPGFYIYLHSL